MTYQCCLRNTAVIISKVENIQVADDVDICTAIDASTYR